MKQKPMQTERPYNLVQDPLFYVTLLFFALVTTVPPALIGQPTFLPVAQAISLTVFAAMAIRRGSPRQALVVVAIWLVAQFVLMMALTWLLPTRLDLVFANGFNLRTATLQWFYTGQDLPRTLPGNPGATLMEGAGVLLGSLATGGLIGAFFLVRAVNFAAFGMGGLLAEGASLLAALPIWTLIKLAGYAGLFTLLSRPLLIKDFSATTLFNQNRRLLLISAGLMIGGLLLELFLPGLWSVWFGQ